MPSLKGSDVIGCDIRTSVSRRLLTDDLFFGRTYVTAYSKYSTTS